VASTEFIHCYCFSSHFIIKSNLEALVNPYDNTTYCACSKRCYNKVKTTLGNNTYDSQDSNSRVVWGKYGQEEPEDISNSLKILLVLDWMTENHSTNYIKFRGKNNILSKQAKAPEIVARLNYALGVRVQCATKQVLNKIYSLE
jgi:hypothetical protein